MNQRIFEIERQFTGQESVGMFKKHKSLSHFCGNLSTFWHIQQEESEIHSDLAGWKNEPFEDVVTN